MGVTRRRFTIRASVANGIDHAFFAFSALAAAWFAYLLLVEGARRGWQSGLLVVFWLFVAYLLLPRLHRILTQIYVPGYFIGRARTADGRLGDPVNLAFRGREQQVHRAMREGGWTRADDLDLRSGMRIVTSTLRRRSDTGAPVSPLVLFGRQQDFAYEREVDGSPSQRHHVRFWRCPDGWKLPGGFAVDWLAAGTYDRSVGLSTFTLQITHKIARDTDVERDFVLATVTGADPSVTVNVIEDFSTGYHARNGGGDAIETDGDLPVVDLSTVDAPPDPVAPPADGRIRLPAPTVFGAGVAVLRALGILIAVVLVVVAPDLVADTVTHAGADLTTRDVEAAARGSALVLAVYGLVDLVLAVAVLRGSNLARLVLMTLCAVATVTAFASDVGGDPITLTHLPTVGVNILVILALSSPRSRAYATPAVNPSAAPRSSRAARYRP
ncbi:MULTISPECIES: LssY C-terminal domain-containing protein [Mumia]|uniref:LssY C-terminal domain-containing protein n=1 Tax=Mumia TaxID=1546255 RepID=UPI00141F7BA8|nr:LssY C-terminal domain-containing protein [Mumia sp. ZJ430]